MKTKKEDDDTEELKIELDPRVTKQMEMDPILAEGMRRMFAAMRQAHHSVREGQHQSFNDAMEAITGHRPERVHEDKHGEWFVMPKPEVTQNAIDGMSLDDAKKLLMAYALYMLGMKESFMPPADQIDAVMAFGEKQLPSKFRSNIERARKAFDLVCEAISKGELP